ncbi:MAG: dihydrodipicolinate synthase family protein [Planctomycetota bacterium]
MARFTGVIPALLTPFDGSGEVSASMLKKLVAFHIDAGVQGLWLCGGSAEAYALSVRERKAIVEVVVAEAAGRVDVIVHVGDNSTEVACELARHAEGIGADAVACFPPVMPKLSAEALRSHYRKVASACGGLPFIAYNVPGLTGVRVDESVMASLLDIENLSGVKHSEYNLFDLRNTIELAADRLSVLEGCDEILLAALAMGAHGGVGLTYNFAPGVYLEIYRSFNAGDVLKAQQEQFRMTRFIRRAIFRYGMHATMKEAMRLLGYDCGPPRTPVLPLGDEERAGVKKELEEAGLV